MLSLDQMKIALDDARTRQVALVQLILFTDQQAMGLLRLYVTLGLAAAAGAAAVSGSNSIYSSLVWGLVASVGVLLVGCIYCFRAMKSADLTLPGKGADFWNSANLPTVTFDDAFARYLADLEEGQKIDRSVNEQASTSLLLAKKCGAWAPAAALIGSLLAHAQPHLITMLR